MKGYLSSMRYSLGELWGTSTFITDSRGVVRSPRLPQHGWGGGFAMPLDSQILVLAVMLILLVDFPRYQRWISLKPT